MLESLVKARVDDFVPDVAARRVLMAKWEEIRRKGDFAQLDRFPVVPLNQVSKFRPALGGLGGAPDKIESPLVKGRLEDIFGECRELASLPKPVSPKLPMMTNGHFPDGGLGLCDQDRSIKFARVLNALVESNGSEVVVAGKRVRSVQKLFETLVASGHRIEMRNERTYANFLSLNWGDQPVIWPVWLDTGLKTKDGRDVVVPTGHSQHTFLIEGPLMRAEVAFFLGTSGVGFFPQVGERPAWTGLRASYTFDSDKDADRIYRAADYAGRYYRRLRKEAQEIVPDLPSGGYGYVGVCNDSNAVLEKVDNGTVTAFPLMRAAELDQKSRGSDGLDEILRALPKDSKDFPRTKENLRRVLQMTPFESLDDTDLHDEELRKVLKSLEAEVGR
jgi:hypothetical protein